MDLYEWDWASELSRDVWSRPLDIKSAKEKPGRERIKWTEVIIKWIDERITSLYRVLSENQGYSKLKSL